MRSTWGFWPSVKLDEGQNKRNELFIRAPPAFRRERKLSARAQERALEAYYFWEAGEAQGFTLVTGKRGASKKAAQKRLSENHELVTDLQTEKRGALLNPDTLRSYLGRWSAINGGVRHPEHESLRSLLELLKAGDPAVPGSAAGDPRSPLVFVVGDCPVTDPLGEEKRGTHGPTTFFSREVIAISHALLDVADREGLKTPRFHVTHASLFCPGEARAFSSRACKPFARGGGGEAPAPGAMAGDEPEVEENGSWQEELAVLSNCRVSCGCGSLACELGPLDTPFWRRMHATNLLFQLNILHNAGFDVAAVLLVGDLASKVLAGFTYRDPGEGSRAATRQIRSRVSKQTRWWGCVPADAQLYPQAMRGSTPVISMMDPSQEWRLKQLLIAECGAESEKACREGALRVRALHSEERQRVVRQLTGVLRSFRCMDTVPEGAEAPEGAPEDCDE